MAPRERRVLVNGKRRAHGRLDFAFTGLPESVVETCFEATPESKAWHPAGAPGASGSEPFLGRHRVWWVAILWGGLGFLETFPVLLDGAETLFHPVVAEFLEESGVQDRIQLGGKLLF